LEYGARCVRDFSRLLLRLRFALLGREISNVVVVE
jgi:hypothetical protein